MCHTSEPEFGTGRCWQWLWICYNAPHWPGQQLGLMVTWAAAVVSNPPGLASGTHLPALWDMHRSDVAVCHVPVMGAWLMFNLVGRQHRFCC
jgi:hypothetical protein